MSSGKDSDTDTTDRRDGHIPSYLPDSIGRQADDALKAALADSSNENGLQTVDLKPSERRFPRVLLHALIVLVATAVWGVVATLIWPEIGTILQGEMGNSSALAAIDAMSDDEISRSLDVWFYFIIGSPIVVLIGFTVVGVLAEHSRLKHVFAVAFIVWLVNSVQILIGTSTLQSHAFSLIKYAVFAAVAVGLSYIFRRPSPDISRNSSD